MKDLALACNPAVEDLLITSRQTGVRLIASNYELYKGQIKEGLATYERSLFERISKCLFLLQCLDLKSRPRIYAHASKPHITILAPLSDVDLHARQGGGQKLLPSIHTLVSAKTPEAYDPISQLRQGSLSVSRLLEPRRTPVPKDSRETTLEYDYVEGLRIRDAVKATKPPCLLFQRTISGSMGAP